MPPAPVPSQGDGSTPQPSLLFDKLAGFIGCSYNVAILFSRWSVFGPSQRAFILLLAVPYCLLYLLLPIYNEPWYRRHRTGVLLGLKGVGLLLYVEGKPLVHTAARLSQPASGKLVPDAFSAFAGLRMGLGLLAGLHQMPWTIWLVQQTVLILRLANVEVDCATTLLSDPSVAGRISSFHSWMTLATGPILPRAIQLVPHTERGRCSVAVWYYSFLIQLLLPALLLVRRSPPGRMPAAGPAAWLRRTDSEIEAGLLALRQWRGPLSLFWWWLVLTLPWAVSSAALSTDK